MEQKTDYAKQQEEKHKRKIILPSVISWEYGSNKFASQKGQRAFGTIRNIKVILNENEEIPVKYPGSLEVEHLPPKDEVEEDQDEPKVVKKESPSGPMFQNSGGGDQDSYRSWIGGQMTTFQPSLAPANQESGAESESEAHSSDNDNDDDDDDNED